MGTSIISNLIDRPNFIMVMVKILASLKKIMTLSLFESLFVVRVMDAKEINESNPNNKYTF